jgi:4,5-DOPA dioxygenase extradiol
MPSPYPFQPVAFVGHGSPMLAVEHGPWHEALKWWAGGLRNVQAVLVVSGHWETAGGFRVSSALRPGVLHDFSGFPESLYRLDYPAPGAPALAAKVVGLLSAAGLEARVDPSRPLDHGAWVPLRALFPGADLPVSQLSLPIPRDPQSLVEAGRALATLRQEGVLVLGSGGLVHNLRRLAWDGHPEPEPWAAAFEAWMLDRVQKQDLVSLIQARTLSPEHALAAPTTEHLDPLYVVLGAAGEDRATEIFKGWQHGNLSLRALAFGTNEKGTELRCPGVDC